MDSLDSAVGIATRLVAGQFTVHCRRKKDYTFLGRKQGCVFITETNIYIYIYIYEGCPESIRPFLISREPFPWP